MAERIHFVTGRLAEFSLRAVLEELAPRAGFEYSIDVLGITVAALMTTDWVARRINVPPGATRVVLPGYCQGELAAVEQAAGVPVERGPRDLRRLAELFGQDTTADDDYGAYDIEILAEINHAPQLALDDIVSEAESLRAAGADVIDLGCDPDGPWAGVEQAVKALVDRGIRVSIDSMDPREIGPAARSGAELVLSVNSQNRDAAPDWGTTVVAVPDDPTTLAGLDETVEFLANHRVPLRIDPILEPIGFGFAASLGRYQETRRRYPDAEMLMGIGNLTELTDADSAPINVLLLGICQELGIRSVLTTQVINWARSSVRECDLARRLVYYAQRHRTLPKRLEPRLVMLRDSKVLCHGEETLARLASQIKDHDYRLFAEDGLLHAVTSGLYARDADPFALFDKLQASAERPIAPSHAFYLGYELAKAVTALTLDKEYRQDEALDWGFLTRDEQYHRLDRTGRQGNAGDKENPRDTEP
ncbi:MAG: dihydropteroate synthase [Planctomycetota bacterium]|nr:MAG: dihydropteroate synthase [Planctomycetota bacterium]